MGFSVLEHWIGTGRSWDWSEPASQASPGRLGEVHAQTSGELGFGPNLSEGNHGA